MPSSNFSGAPPVPPSVGAGQAPSPAMPPPGLMQLAGMGGPPGMGGGPQQTAGMSQMSDSVVRMGAEIDQALKLLAQALPNVAPWVEKTVMELRFQIGTALQSGAVPTNPTPSDNQQFPDGGGRL